MLAAYLNVRTPVEKLFGDPAPFIAIAASTVANEQQRSMVLSIPGAPSVDDAAWTIACKLFGSIANTPRPAAMGASVVQHRLRRRIEGII